MNSGIYALKATDINGQERSLKEFEGQVLLIVNVASQCGFTPQYQGLESLHQKFKDQGFSVLGFPCNQFGAQEPGDSEEIKNFCSSKFQVSFPLFEKIKVNGDDAHPIFQFLKKQQKGLLGTEAIKWNFTKFLVDKNGQVVSRFAPKDSPQSLQPQVEALL